MSQILGVPTLVINLLLEMSTIVLQDKYNIGVQRLVNFNLKSSPSTKNLCSKSERMRRLMTSKKRLSFYWLKIHISYSKMKIWSNLSTKRKIRFNYLRRGLITNTITPALQNPKRKKYLIISISKIKNIKFK